jgi:hypothetical protein
VNAAARIADLDADLLTALIASLTDGQGRPEVASIQAKIRSALKQVDAAVDEANRERKAHLSDYPDPEPLGRTLHRVRHDLVIIARVCATALPPSIAPAIAEPLSNLRDAGVALLRGIAAGLRAGEAPPDTSGFDASLSAYIAAMEGLRAVGVTRALESDQVGRIYALRFGFEQLGLDLRDLSRRGGELVQRERTT